MPINTVSLPDAPYYLILNLFTLKGNFKTALIISWLGIQTLYVRFDSLTLDRIYASKIAIITRSVITTTPMIMPGAEQLGTALIRKCVYLRAGCSEIFHRPLMYEIKTCLGYAQLAWV